MRRKTRELVDAVGVVVRYWLRKAGRRGWTARDKYLVLVLAAALVEETPFFAPRGAAGIGRREPLALAKARMALTAGEPMTLARAMDEVERELVSAALSACGGSQAKASRLLGISQRSMWHRVKKLEIDPEKCRREARR